MAVQYGRAEHPAGVLLDSFLYGRAVAAWGGPCGSSDCLWLPLDPEGAFLEDGPRDVRGVGHHGTGDLELAIRGLDDLEKAKPLIQKSFEEN
jgi:hypothetical protein